MVPGFCVAGTVPHGADLRVAAGILLGRDQLG